MNEPSYWDMLISSMESNPESAHHFMQDDGESNYTVIHESRAPLKTELTKTDRITLYIALFLKEEGAKSGYEIDMFLSRFGENNTYLNLEMRIHLTRMGILQRIQNYLWTLTPTGEKILEPFT